MNEQCFKFNFITNRFQPFDQVNPLTVYFVAEDGFPPSLKIIEWATVKKAVFSEE